MLQYDPAEAVATLRRADQTLAGLMQKAGPCAMSTRAETAMAMDTLQALLRSIIYQQLSGKAAATIHGRVLALFPDGVTAGQLLDMEEEALRSAGMSRAKVLASKDLARKTLDGVVPPLAQLQQLGDEEIVKRLSRVRGIGRWTVEMLLMFHLGRADVLPVTDLGVRKGFMLAYRHKELPEPGALQTYGERWRPYRSVASWYMWRALEVLA